VGSLLVAVTVVGLFAWTQRSSGPGGDALDARLTDPGAVITYPNDGIGNQAVAGTKLPEVTLTDADGNEVDTADLLGGRPLVVNLWFSTCAPCAKELPEFAAVDAERDDVRFVGVNALDSVEVMNKFANERGVQYELLRDNLSELADGIGAVAMPVTLFVTSDGTIVQQTGRIDADQLRADIDQLMIAESKLS
jgi:peroxiredoxin